MKDFKKYFPLPLKLDEPPYSSYAWTNKGDMALTFDDDVMREEALAIVDTINGEANETIPNLKFDGVDFFDGDTYIFCIRGWGNLTGIGGHNFSHERAEKIQDAFRDYVYEQLKGKDE